jgi:hypothetical protein
MASMRDGDVTRQFRHNRKRGGKIMLARKIIFAAAAVATLGLAAPAFAGEGSPDISMGPYGNYGQGPNYPYVTAPDYMLTEPAYPAGPGYSEGFYEPDYNVGYGSRSRIMQNRANDERGINSY